uniref:Scaffoldin C n=1 Tax=Ruminococcus flavefaciens TaxID=1265 RepID=G9FF50_RUMFL|nr:scaffoldin C [Ruminococcus flavefaciens]
MKTKKVIVGAMAAMLSLSVCPLATATAADDTVQISVGKTTAEVGGAFTVEVSLADIPATGIQATNFSIEYDKNLITVTDIKAGKITDTGASSADSSASLLPNFNSYINNEKGLMSFMWTTSLDESSNWIKGEGTFCTITGTVASGAKAGTVADISIVPTDRETYAGSGVKNTEIDCGYTKDGAKVSYAVKTTAGSVTVAGGEVTTTTKPAETTTKPATETTTKPAETTSGTGKVTLKGDANVDGKVTVADAVAILQSIGNKDKYELKPQGKLNGDVDGVAGITGSDALRIQMLDAGKITELNF